MPAETALLCISCTVSYMCGQCLGSSIPRVKKSNQLKSQVRVKNCHYSLYQLAKTGHIGSYLELWDISQMTNSSVESSLEKLQ